MANKQTQRKTGKVMVLLPPSLQEAVEQIARREMTSNSEVGRRAIALFVEQRRQEGAGNDRQAA